MIEMILLTIPTWLTPEIAGAVATYVGTVLSIVKYFQKLVKDQRTYYESKIEHSAEGLRKEFMREVSEMKNDIQQTNCNLMTYETKTDALVKELKDSLSDWKLEITKSLAEIKTIIQIQMSKKDKE